MKSLCTLLLAGVLLVGVGARADAVPITVPSDIAFDAYCDGVHYEAGPGDAVSGHMTGCFSFAIMGARGSQGGLVHMVDCGAGFGTVYYIIRPDFTWANFVIAGGAVTPLYAGTWHYGTPAPGVGQSTMTPGGPTGGGSGLPVEPIFEGAIGIPADIAYDGYCDGVHYQEGPGGAVKGRLTGCYSGYRFIGARGADGGLVHVVDCGAGIGTLLYIVRPDNTWSNFQLSNGTVAPLNSGTWHYGTPPAEAQGRSSAQR